MYRSPSQAALLAFGLDGTPQTIVIGKDGEVLRSWGGAYVGSIEKEVAAYFDLSLPGVAPDGDVLPVFAATPMAVRFRSARRAVVG